MNNNKPMTLSIFYCVYDISHGILDLISDVNHCISGPHTIVSSRLVSEGYRISKKRSKSLLPLIRSASRGVNYLEFSWKSEGGSHLCEIGIETLFLSMHVSPMNSLWQPPPDLSDICLKEDRSTARSFRSIQNMVIGQNISRYPTFYNIHLTLPSEKVDGDRLGLFCENILESIFANTEFSSLGFIEANNEYVCFNMSSLSSLLYGKNFLASVTSLDKLFDDTHPILFGRMDVIGNIAFKLGTRCEYYEITSRDLNATQNGAMIRLVDVGTPDQEYTKDLIKENLII